MKGACEKVAVSGVVGTPGLLQGLLGVPLPVVVAGRTPVVEEEEVVEEGELPPGGRCLRRGDI